jgi:hypothetical protein
MAPQSRPCPHRCFLSDISGAIQDGKRIFRLLGTVVSLIQEEGTFLLQLDDGSALASIVTPTRMLEQIQVSVGMTVESIVKLIDNELEADQLVIIQDVHTETLRWLELSFRKTQPEHHSCLKWGYPNVPIQAEDVHDLIQSEATKGGVSIYELSIVLDLEQSNVADLIQELQIAGQIYRNPQGRYLPL